MPASSSCLTASFTCMAAAERCSSLAAVPMTAMAAPRTSAIIPDMRDMASEPFLALSVAGIAIAAALAVYELSRTRGWV